MRNQPRNPAMLLLGVVGVVGVVILALYANQAKSKRSEVTGEVLSFASQIALGEPQKDVRSVFQRQGYKHLTLLESGPALWVVKTPFELFGANWFMWIQFSGGEVTGVRVRTQQDIERLPPGAPADRLSPRQPKEFPSRPF